MNKMEVAILLNELFLKSEEEFFKIEEKVKEVVQEPNK